MASPMQYASITTAGASVTVTGKGDILWVKNLDGAGIVSVRVDGTAADVTAAEGNLFLAKAAGDAIPIPVRSLTLDGSLTVSLDADATTKVALWLEQRNAVG